jgi:hypothetical protein
MTLLTYLCSLIKNSKSFCSVVDLSTFESRPIHDLIRTWQGIWLGEHRNEGGNRKLMVTINGEPN